MTDQPTDAPQNETPRDNTESAFRGDRDVRQRQYGIPIFHGELTGKHLSQVSGLAASRTGTELLWAIDDDHAELHALHPSGAQMARVRIRGIKSQAMDWEDITSYQLPCGESRLLIADTGGNSQPGRREFRLHGLADPGNSQQQSPSIRAEWTISFSYERRKNRDRHDCEAVAVDTSRNQILLMTKPRKETTRPWLFTLPLNGSTGRKLTAEYVGRIESLVRITADHDFRRCRPTSMEISDDGKHAVVLTYGHAYAFTRKPQESWLQCFNGRPAVIKLPPLWKAESICFSPQHSALWITTERPPKERRPAPLIRIPYNDIPCE